MVLIVYTILCIFQHDLERVLVTLQLYIPTFTSRYVFYDDRKHESNFLCDHQYLFMLETYCFDFSY